MSTSSNSAEKEQSIMGCLSKIVGNIVTKKKFSVQVFNENVFEENKADIDYVSKKCKLSPMQVILLATCIENYHGRCYYKADLATSLGLSYITLLSHDMDLKALVDSKLLIVRHDEKIKIPDGLIEKLINNEDYTVPDKKVSGTAALMKEVKKLFEARIDEDIDESELMKEMDELMDANKECSFVKRCMEYKILGDGGIYYLERLVFYNLVYRYLYEDDDVVGWHNYEDIIEDSCDINRLRREMRNEKLCLQELGIVEPAYEDGFANSDYFHIKDDVKEVIFEEVGGVRKKSKKGRMKLIPCSEIQPKTMFYNPSEELQIGRLNSLLQEETYKATCQRLKESGLRTGFSCIFYGSPGTGKTESVYQLAKATGRAIVPVNVSEIKSCWVGESEKLIKGVFDKYRSMVEDSETAPILLFNEADAIFGIRKESATDAVDKMENSIQNIILQEMEKLNGILIATTNLTQNLDKAFERRFLYKVKFDKPSTEAKSKIWRSLIPDLTEGQAMDLASSFDFSGGQIENVSRKKMIQGIIDGTTPDYEEIRSYCTEENIIDKTNGRNRIGF